MREVVIDGATIDDDSIFANCKISLLIAVISNGCDEETLII